MRESMARRLLAALPMRRTLPAGLLALSLFGAHGAQADEAPNEAMLGGPGESCRARADCKRDLKCVAGVCTHEGEGQACGATKDCGGGLRCIDRVCTSGVSPSTGKKADTEGGGADAGDFLEGTHGYVGTSVGAGGGVAFNSAGAEGGGAFHFNLRAGVLLGRLQLEIELSPVTQVFFGATTLPVFQGNLAVGYLIPLSKTVSWPLRVGVGGGFYLASGATRGAFAVRGDLIGVEVRLHDLPNLAIEATLPSFRYYTDFTTGNIMALEALLGLTYAF